MRKTRTSNDANPKAPLSEQELITASIQTVLKERESRKPQGFGFPMPERRRVKNGDSVVLGNLEDVVVVQDTVDGLPDHVVVRYTRVDHNYGRPIRIENQFRAVHLSEIFRKPTQQPEGLQGPGYSDVFKKLKHASRQVESILHEKAHWASDSPDFQRDYVWTLEDKQKLILSVLQGQPMGSMIIARDETYKTREYYFLDGKQRVNALAEFYCGCFPVLGRYYDELCGDDAAVFTQAIVSVYYLDLNKVSRKEVLELFLLVNSAGVPQTEEHLAKVRAMLAQLNSKP